MIDTASAFDPARTGHPFPSGTMYLRVEGVLSEPGAYGLLSAFRRELMVSRVLEATVEVPSSCP